MKIIMNDKDIKRSLKRIAHEIIERNQGSLDLVILGIKTGGCSLGKKIEDLLADIEEIPVIYGDLDISNFRDDISIENRVCSLDIDVKDKVVILVDDVLYTGRTGRAALDAVMSLGRPKKIQLAVLIDRGHRELPIRADFVGKNLPTSKEETVKVVMNDESESFVAIS